MKKKRKLIILTAVILLVGVATVTVLLVFNQSDRIRAFRVEKIEVGEYELTWWESIRFIYLFNTAEYKGEGIGDGGTAEYMFYVWNRDDSFMIVREFGNKERNFEITTHSPDAKENSWYYVYSEKLEAFAEELLSKD